MQRYKKSSISRGNVPFLGRFPRLIDTFLLIAEDFLLTKLQVGGPVEYEKQLEQLLQLVTTLSISHAQNRARSGYAMARKGTMKWNLHASRVTILLHGKQQNTTLRLGHSCRLSLRSVVHCCKSCSSCFPYPAGCIGANTTFTICNNAFDKPCAEPSSLGFCHGEKGCHEMERFALDIPADCPCEALFIVVSLAATFGQNGPRRGDVPAKRCLKL